MPKRLTILHYCFANEFTGLGHHFRSLALAQAAQDRGHIVFIASNRQPPKQFRYLPAEYLSPAHYAGALQAAKPDWVVVDLPHTLPDWIRELAPDNTKICTLNGIGYDQADNWVNLRVIQGVADLELPKGINRGNTVMGIDYVIIRPEIERYRDNLRWYGGTLVWGGGNDYLGILPKMVSLYFNSRSLYLVVADMTPEPKHINKDWHSVNRISGDGLGMIERLAVCRDAAVAMGMITWESAYLSTPCYVFSYSPLHLMFAQGMERYGLIKAWPEVGLPSDDEIREFLAEPFKINEENRPKGDGAINVLKEIEKR